MNILRQPLVSVLMPAYHSKSFICQSVNSVLTQTYPYWELVIIADDGVNYEAVLAVQMVNPHL
jgi:succinoglycan biosynthesis protein ExoO